MLEILTALILSPYSTASSSINGAIMRHGPHQGAQKSTMTGTGLSNTNSFQLLSFTAGAAFTGRPQSGTSYQLQCQKPR